MLYYICDYVVYNIVDQWHVQSILGLGAGGWWVLCQNEATDARGKYWFIFSNDMYYILFHRYKKFLKISFSFYSLTGKYITEC